MLKKIAFVCQRYGLEVNGGAELHCRQLAERLNEYYDVEVFTTCAVDYITWENVYPGGEEYINEVLVRRFPVDFPRDMKMFGALSADIFSNKIHSTKNEEEWLRAQGPVSGELLHFIEDHYEEYQAIIYMTYLYYPTAVGILLDVPNKLLIPTAHDEPPIYLRHYKKVFQAPKGIIYNTTEEQAFIQKKFGNSQIPSVICGVGVDAPAPEEVPSAKERFGIEDDYVVYVGRIDVSKGCRELFDYFRAYKRRNPGKLKLVLAGKAVMDVPRDPDIISLGFISDEEKFAVIRDAKCLVLASEFESLSMVVLESMIMGRPVLVNGKCMVLKGHCKKSNAGLYFENYAEFEGALNYLLSHPEQYEQMRENGKKYVKENYDWQVIVDKIRGMIESLKPVDPEQADRRCQEKRKLLEDRL